MSGPRGRRRTRLPGGQTEGIRERRRDRDERNKLRYDVDNPTVKKCYCQKRVARVVGRRSTEADHGRTSFIIETHADNTIYVFGERRRRSDVTTTGAGGGAVCLRCVRGSSTR